MASMNVQLVGLGADTTDGKVSNSAPPLLRQKLTSMENDLHRVHSAKAQLRSNAEKARLDISACFGHQLELVRSREQQLLGNLTTMVSDREQKLASHQARLNQGIGACQQALTDSAGSLKSEAVPTNPLGLKAPRVNVNLRFRHESDEFRLAVSRLGEILVVDEGLNAGKESLPMEVEHEYEDIDSPLMVGMNHKSVLRLPIQSSASTNQIVRRSLSPRSLNYWLGQMKLESSGGSMGDGKVDNDCLELAIAPRRERLASSGSSIELIEELSPSQNTSEPASRKRHHRATVDGIEKYGFVRVIKAIRESPMEEWLAKRNKMD